MSPPLIGYHIAAYPLKLYRILSYITYFEYKIHLSATGYTTLQSKKCNWYLNCN